MSPSYDIMNLLIKLIGTHTWTSEAVYGIVKGSYLVQPILNECFHVLLYGLSL